MFSSLVLGSLFFAGLCQASYYLPGVTPHAYEEEEPVGVYIPYQCSK